MENKDIEPVTWILNPLDHMYHIFSHEKFTLCMVCNEKISTKNISSHINCKVHEKSFRGMFEVCFPNSLFNNSDNTYLDIIMNSVFDISLGPPGCETSYVIYHNEHVFCVFCQLNICESDGSWVKIRQNLVDHLQSNIHFESIKNNVFWVYCCDRKSKFVMFHKTVIYCSSCKQNIISSEKYLLKSIADHLQTYQHIRDENKNSKSRLCKQFDPLKVIDKKSSSLNNNQLTTDLTGCDISFEDLSNCDIANNSSTYNNEGNDDELRLCKQFDSLKVKKNEAPSWSDNLLTADLTDCGTSLLNCHIASNSSALFTCIKCGKFVDIYSNNYNFSVQLNSQIRKELSNTFDYLRYVFHEGNDYKCHICQSKILVFNGDIELSINRHLEDSKFLVCKDFHLTKNANYDTSLSILSSIFDVLPKNISKYKNFVIAINQSYVLCQLCYCVVTLNKDILVASKILHDHLANPYHNVQYNTLSKDLTPESNKLSAEHKQKSKGKKRHKAKLSKQNSLLETLINKCPIIKKNKQFILKHKSNYLCTLCNIHICNSPDEYILSSNFVSHFTRKFHSNSLDQEYTKVTSVNMVKNEYNEILSEKKQIVPSQSNTSKPAPSYSVESDNTYSNYMKQVLKKLSRHSYVVKESQKFVEYNEKDLFCKLCKKCVGFTKSGREWKIHCYSYAHGRKILQKKQIKN